MIVPVINFPGICAEAQELYKKAFGMKVDSVAYYLDAPEGYMVFDEANKHYIMHSECSFYGIRVNMSDNTEGKIDGSLNFNVFLPTDDDVRAAFEIIKEGATEIEELSPQFWTSLHGAAVDRFGVSWQIMTE